MKICRIKAGIGFPLILLLIFPIVYSQAEDAEQPKIEKGKLEIWFRLTTTPMTERELYYHVCKLYINGKEMGESAAINKESKWVKTFSLELDEGIYDIKILHGYASKTGKWAGEFPKQPKLFRVEIKKGPEIVIKYGYNVGLFEDTYIYDKVPPVPQALTKAPAGYKPRILVIIPEQHLQQMRIPDPASETEIIRKFVENDFYVVDQIQVREIRYNDESKRALQGDTNAVMAIGRQFDAEVLVIGEAFSQRTDFSIPGSVECNARVEARAMRVDTGQILAAHSFVAATIGNSEEIASKQALAKAGGMLGDYMVQEILKKWTTKAVPSVRVKLANVEFKQLIAFEQVLNEKIKGVKGFSRRNFDVSGKIADIDVDIEGGSQALSTELTSQEIPDFNVEVLNFSANSLDLRFKPKDASRTALALCPNFIIFMDYTNPDGTMKKCKVMLSKFDETSLEYNWAIELPDGNTQSGTFKIASLDKSHNYGVDWKTGADEASDGTAPWVSKDVFRELKKNGFTTITMNKQIRKDAIVMAEIKGMTKFPVILNGKEEELEAIQVNTDKGDKLLILDEMGNPLVLSAEVAGVYSSKVTNIYIPGYR